MRPSLGCLRKEGAVNIITMRKKLFVNLFPQINYRTDMIIVTIGMKELQQNGIVVFKYNLKTSAPRRIGAQRASC